MQATHADASSDSTRGSLPSRRKLCTAGRDTSATCHRGHVELGVSQRWWQNAHRCDLPTHLLSLLTLLVIIHHQLVITNHNINHHHYLPLLNKLFTIINHHHHSATPLSSGTSGSFCQPSAISRAALGCCTTCPQTPTQ